MAQKSRIFFCGKKDSSSDKKNLFATMQIYLSKKMNPLASSELGQEDFHLEIRSKFFFSNKWSVLNKKKSLQYGVFTIFIISLFHLCTVDFFSVKCSFLQQEDDFSWYRTYFFSKNNIHTKKPKHFQKYYFFFLTFFGDH